MSRHVLTIGASHIMVNNSYQQKLSVSMPGKENPSARKSKYRKAQKHTEGQYSLTENQEQQERSPLEPTMIQQKQYLDQHPITLENGTSRFNTLESRTTRKRAKTYQREFGSGLSKFLQENKHYREKSLIPGPGQYQTCIMRKTFKGGAFFKSPQYPSTPIIAPGPGSYDAVKSGFGRRGYSIGKSERRLNLEDIENPGPASYQIPKVDSVKSKTGRVIFPKAKMQSETPKTPGPGSYNSNLSTLSRRSALIKGRIRFSLKNAVAPGPVDYHPNYQAASYRRCSAFFSKPRLSGH